MLNLYYKNNNKGMSKLFLSPLAERTTSISLKEGRRNTGAQNTKEPHILTGVIDTICSKCYNNDIGTKIMCCKDLRRQDFVNSHIYG